MAFRIGLKFASPTRPLTLYIKTVEAHDFIPPGFGSVEEFEEWILERHRDFDDDGYPNALDDCPKTPGTSERFKAWTPRGCPDSDSDGVAGSVDICPNAVDHETCLSNQGLYTFDPSGIFTCRCLREWRDLMRNSKWILWGTASVTGIVGVVVRAIITTAGVVGLQIGLSGQIGGILLTSGAQANATSVYTRVCN